MMATNNATVVLVHGAWADGSSWAKVIMALAATGVKAVAPPLPLTSFHDDVSALDRTLERGRRGDARREGEGARLCGRARPGRRRDGRGRVHSRHTASAGTQARPGRARFDVSARS